MPKSTVWLEALAYWHSVLKAIDPSTLAAFGITREATCTQWVTNVYGTRALRD